MRRTVFLFAPAALIAAVLLAACGGGGGGGTSSPATVSLPTTSASASPTPVPVPIVTASPTSGPTVAPNATFGPIPAFNATPIPVTPASGGTTIAIAPINGITGALSLGNVDPQDGLGTNYTVTLSNAPYPGVPDFAQTTPGVKGEILYLLVAPPAGVNYLGGASLALTLPPKYQGASNYYVGLYISGPAIVPAWPTATNGKPASSIVNGTVTFQFPTLTLSPGYQYSIVLYAV